MAMAALMLGQPRIQEGSYRDNLGKLSSGQHVRASISLYFPSDTLGMLTRFRKKALNYIYRTALALSEGRLESAAVSLSSQPDEADSLTLDLAMTIDADWEFIKKLRREILVKVGEWSQEWSEEEKTDYGRRIYFGFIPSNL